MNVEDSRIGSTLGVGIGFSVGLALGSQIYSQGGAAVLPTVDITSPAPGTTFYTGAGAVVSGTSTGLVGDTIECSWTSDFAVINGTSGPVAGDGTWSLTATPAWADGIAAVERATLYFRSVTLGGSALKTLSAPIFTSLSAAVQVGTVVLAYDAWREYTQSVGVLTALAPLIGGTAADVLVNSTPSLRLLWQSVAALGGRYAAVGTGTQWMQSATPASAVTQAQRFQRIVVGVSPTSSLNSENWVDSADATNRCFLQKRLTTDTFRYSAGTTIDTGIAFAARPCIVIADHNGNSSTVSIYEDGSSTPDTSGPDAINTNSLQGTTWCATNSGANIAVASVTAEMWVTGLDATDITRMLQWLMLTPVRGGCDFDGMI